MNREQVGIKTPFIKLDSFLKYCGVCATGGEAKNIIQDGLVSVNGETCRTRGKKLVGGEIVATAGREFEVSKK